MTKSKAQKQLLFMILLLLVLNISYAGWEKTYDSGHHEHGSSLDLTIDCGYIIAGHITNLFTGHTDFYVVRTDSLGDTIWTAKYGRDEWSDIAYSIEATDDSGFIITGYTSQISESTNVSVVKLDADGDTMWTHIYDGGVGEGDAGYCIQQTSDGEYILVGNTCSFGSGTQVWLLRLNSVGDTIWTHTYGGSATDDGFFVSTTRDGGYIIVGRTNSYGDDFDFYLIKTDEYGNTMWTKTYGIWGSEIGWCVRQTSDGGYIIAGDCGKVCLIKTNELGDTMWTRLYGFPVYQTGRAVEQTRDGGYIIIGTTEFYGVTNGQIWLIKTNEYGDTVWTRMYGGMWYDYGRDVTQTSDGGYIIAGATQSFGAGDWDVYLIKTDSLGNVDWVREVPTRPRQIGLSVHPNPFNEACEIKVASYESQVMSVEIYDLRGNLVWQAPPLSSNSFLPEEKGEPMDAQPQSLSPWGERFRERGSVTWRPAPSIPSGVYLVKARAGEQETTKKVVMIR